MQNLIDFSLLSTYDAELKSLAGLWKKGNAYNVGDIVGCNGKYLKCITAGTSGTTSLNLSSVTTGSNVNDGTCVWEVVDPFTSGGGASISGWVTSTSYSVGDLVINNNKIYSCTVAHTSTTFASDIANWTEISASITHIDDWVATTSYVQGDLVANSAKIYRCITTHTSGSTFDSTEALNWEELSPTINEITGWESGTSYAQNQLVIYNDKLYQCNTAHTSTTFSSDISNWTEISANIDQITDWATSITYSVGDIVIESGILYKCNTAHTSTTFSSDVANWAAITVKEMVGATSSVNGESGIVPQPTTSDIDKFLCGDGTWKDANASLNVIVDTLWENTTSATISASDVLTLSNPVNNYDFILLSKGNSGNGTMLVTPDRLDGNRTLILPSVSGSLNYGVSLLPSGNSCTVIYINGNGNLDYIKGIKFLNNNVYSTTEQRIGTWIDGKPLYQKTISYTIPTGSGLQKLTIATLQNVDRVAEIFGVSAYGVPVNAAEQNTTYAFSITCWFDTSTKELNLTHHNDGGDVANITIRYTKV